MRMAPHMVMIHDHVSNNSRSKAEYKAFQTMM
jgi:hypothetical protein